MSNKKAKTFNGQVFQKTYRRLNLTPIQRIVFYRLLGFLIRNNKPFPYSAVAMAEITGFSVRTIFNVLNDLERCRLINRHGMGKNRRFSRGSILNKILTTVQNDMVKNLTTVHVVHQNFNNRAPGSFKKTSSSLKHKEGGSLSQEHLQQIAWYRRNPEMKVSEEDKWMFG